MSEQANPLRINPHELANNQLGQLFSEQILPPAFFGEAQYCEPIVPIIIVDDRTIAFSGLRHSLDKDTTYALNATLWLRSQRELITITALLQYGFHSQQAPDLRRIKIKQRMQSLALMLTGPDGQRYIDAVGRTKGYNFVVSPQLKLQDERVSRSYVEHPAVLGESRTAMQLLAGPLAGLEQPVTMQAPTTPEKIRTVKIVGNGQLQHGHDDAGFTLTDDERFVLNVFLAVDGAALSQEEFIAAGFHNTKSTDYERAKALQLAIDSLGRKLMLPDDTTPALLQEYGVAAMYVRWSRPIVFSDARATPPPTSRQQLIEQTSSRLPDVQTKHNVPIQHGAEQAQHLDVQAVERLVQEGKLSLHRAVIISLATGVLLPSLENISVPTHFGRFSYAILYSLIPQDKGLSARQIADIFDVHPRTVTFTISDIQGQVGSSGYASARPQPKKSVTQQPKPTPPPSKTTPKQAAAPRQPSEKPEEPKRRPSVFGANDHTGVKDYRPGATLGLPKTSRRVTGTFWPKRDTPWPDPERADPNN